MRDEIIVDDLTEPLQETLSKEIVDKVKVDPSNAKIRHGTIYDSRDEKILDSWKKIYEKQHMLGKCKLRQLLHDECSCSDDFKEWCESEIRISEKRRTEYGDCFDGVEVGNENRIMLNERHIKFCENVLKQMK